MDPTLGVIVAASVGALGAYLAAAKRFSGKIESSDASELWKESSAIRAWSGDQLARLTDELAELKARVAALEGSNEELAGENRVLLRENERLKGQVRGLSTELGQCRRRVTELEAQIA